LTFLAPELHFYSDIMKAIWKIILQLWPNTSWAKDKNIGFPQFIYRREASAVVWI
jgi:hypothetical protein